MSLSGPFRTLRTFTVLLGSHRWFSDLTAPLKTPRRYAAVIEDSWVSPDGVVLALGDGDELPEGDALLELDGDELSEVVGEGQSGGGAGEKRHGLSDADGDPVVCATSGHMPPPAPNALRVNSMVVNASAQMPNAIRAGHLLRCTCLFPILSMYTIGLLR